MIEKKPERRKVLPGALGHGFHAPHDTTFDDLLARIDEADEAWRQARRAMRSERHQEK